MKKLVHARRDEVFGALWHNEDTKELISIFIEDRITEIEIIGINDADWHPITEAEAEALVDVFGVQCAPGEEMAALTNVLLPLTPEEVDPNGLNFTHISEVPDELKSVVRSWIANSLTGELE